ncbi:hypothetical protein BKI52_38860 [marine bacterium AO1-C]|nr:hypothetical protein BKI52_38860 [marine bacterium AO1-C]
MNWFTYIFSFAVCHALLLVFYRFFLEKERIHTIKRYYLLATVLIAGIIPLITFPVYVYEAPAKVLSVQVESLQPLVHSTDFTLTSPANTQIPWLTLLWMVYFGGVLVFGLRFIKNLSYIFTQIFRSSVVRVNRFIYVLISQEVIPHAFLKYIFLNKEWYTNQLIPQEVLIHEEAHAQQLHSLDLLFVELLGVFMWFNPFVYLMKNATQLNHEFLADQYVLDRGIAKSNYQESILKLSITEPPLAFSNAFGYSFIKKRFLMMQKKSNNATLYRKAIMFSLLTGTLLFSFSGRSLKVAQIQSGPSPVILENLDTSDAIAEYNRLAKYYNQYPKTDFVKKVKDMWRIRKLYESIPANKRAQLEKYPVSTTGLSIFITNDGKYLIDKKEVKLAEIGSLFQTLSAQERSNVYVFDEKKDYQAYVKRNRANKSEIPNNDVYVHLCSEEIINTDALKLLKAAKLKNSNLRLMDYAMANNKLTVFVQQLHKTLEKHNIQVNR